MFVWEDPKAPLELKDYLFNWTKDLGSDTIQSASAEFVDGYDAGLTIEEDEDFEGAYSKVWLSGGTAGETARIRGTIITVGGRTFTEVGILSVLEKSDPATSTLDQLVADLAALKSARLTMLTTGGVKEVSRDGRRIIYNIASIADLDRAIASYEGYVADATVAADPTAKRRFRALSVRF